MKCIDELIAPQNTTQDFRYILCLRINNTRIQCLQRVLPFICKSVPRCTHPFATIRVASTGAIILQGNKVAKQSHGFINHK